MVLESHATEKMHYYFSIVKMQTETKSGHFLKCALGLKILRTIVLSHISFNFYPEHNRAFCILAISSMKGWLFIIFNVLEKNKLLYHNYHSLLMEKIISVTPANFHLPSQTNNKLVLHSRLSTHFLAYSLS